ncbi:apolipoprotein A-IV [Halyomorpha halys]|uniref:apolipoprotein A-IV n=1 Tax=Halyomorpha halys TaxID=286706 RepID=UPI0006D4D659|nr:uncharacterized protein LOC106677138 [Halyomorpha halys]
MDEAKPYCDKLIADLGNIISEEQKEEFRKQLEIVAGESLKNLEQLKDSVKKLAGDLQKGAEGASEKLERAFNEFQKNMEGLQEKRRQQADDVCKSLGGLLERLKQANVSGSTKNDLQQKTEDLMKKIYEFKEHAQTLSQDIMDQIKDLNETYSKVNENRYKEMVSTIGELAKIFTEATNKDPAKKYSMFCSSTSEAVQCCLLEV